MRCSPRADRGLTLIEVLASLVLLGVLFTGLLLGKARLTRQWSHAQQRLAAVEVADRLLETWASEGQGVPLPGAVPGAGSSEGFRWSTELLPPDELEVLGYRRVRLSLRPEDSPQSGGLSEPLCEVDIVVPIAEDAP